MRITDNVKARISARDRADRLINKLTAGVALTAVGALGVFAAVGANTVPGSSGSTAGATASTSASTSSSASAVQSTSSSVSSSSSTGVAVSGGSH